MMCTLQQLLHTLIDYCTVKLITTKKEARLALFLQVRGLPNSCSHHSLQQLQQRTAGTAAAVQRKGTTAAQRTPEASNLWPHQMIDDAVTCLPANTDSRSH